VTEATPSNGASEREAAEFREAGRKQMAERAKRYENGASVRGECPMGCGRTLFLGDGGYVTCSWRYCPNPAAADELLHWSIKPALIRAYEDLRRATCVR
jgi:hypothetical protein